MQGHIVSTRRFRTPSSLDESLDAIADTFLDFRKELGNDRLPGIGVSLRGIINRDTGTLVYGSRPEWRNVPIRQKLEQRLREPVTVENNVRAAALAEYTYGSSDFAAKRCFVFLGIDEGVGMAVVFDGKLHHGPHMAAGECGEMVIRAHAPALGHDAHRKGARTLEELVSNGAVCRRYAETTGGTRKASAGDTTARVRKIVEAARSGDQNARETLLETAEYLGIAIANLVWTMDADSVVVDGAITAAWPLIHPAIQKQLPDFQEVWGARNLLLRASSLGGEAALIGAATLSLSLIFTHGPETGITPAPSR
jgi:glucokinase